jgi:cytochrome d ubiquinol oxidase subunit I
MVFWSFRVMVGVGMLMLAVSWVGWWWCRRCGWHRERLPRWLLWVLAGMTFSGWVATAGRLVRDRDRPPALCRLRPADAPPKLHRPCRRG